MFLFKLLQWATYKRIDQSKLDIVFVINFDYYNPMAFFLVSTGFERKRPNIEVQHKNCLKKYES